MERYQIVWAPGWPERLQKAVKNAGFENLTAFLQSVPAMPYVDVAHTLGYFAAVQVVRVQFQEALKANKPRAAAMDALAREIRWHLPEGWGLGEKPDWGRIMTFSSWAATLETNCAVKEDDPVLMLVFDALEAGPPPTGWKPSGPDDPLIVAAFEKGWPETK